MAERPEILDLSPAEQRGVNIAVALAREQLRCAVDIAREHGRPGEPPEPSLVAALLQAMATNYAAVK